MWFLLLAFTLHALVVAGYGRARSDKLVCGRQQQPFVNWLYAWYWIHLWNSSINTYQSMYFILFVCVWWVCMYCIVLCFVCMMCGRIYMRDCAYVSVRTSVCAWVNSVCVRCVFCKKRKKERTKTHPCYAMFCLLSARFTYNYKLCFSLDHSFPFTIVICNVFIVELYKV